MNRRRAVDRGVAILLLVAGLIVVSPLLMMVASSLKPDRFQIMAEMGSLKAFYVTNPTLDNFRTILAGSTQQSFARFFLNSVIVLACAVVGTIGVSSMAAYTLLRGRLRIHRYILPVVVALYIVPAEAIMLPLMYQAAKMGLIDTYVIQFLPFIAGPFYIFLFYQFFLQLPVSIAESAGIEGASFWQTFSRIYFPTNSAAVTTVAILMGLESWNQYLWPVLVTTTQRVRPISVAIAGFPQTGNIYWNTLMAAAVLTMIPILLLFLVMQRQFVASAMSSAVKG
jgi:multiple sugar transport system permease protein